QIIANSTSISNWKHFGAIHLSLSIFIVILFIILIGLGVLFERKKKFYNHNYRLRHSAFRESRGSLDDSQCGLVSLLDGSTTWTSCSDLMVTPILIKNKKGIKMKG